MECLDVGQNVHRIHIFSKILHKTHGSTNGKVPGCESS